MSCDMLRFGSMIESFRHKGLRRLYEEEDRRSLPPEMVGRIQVLFAALDAAKAIEDLHRPSFRLHPLKGELKVIGRSRFGPTGGSSFASKTAMSLMLIWWIITKESL